MDMDQNGLPADSAKRLLDRVATNQSSHSKKPRISSPRRSITSALSFDSLVQILSPNLDVITCSTVWKKDIDLLKGFVVLYQADFHASIPRLTKCVRIRELQTPDGARLIPYVYVGDSALSPTYSRGVMGRGYIENLTDLAKLLENLNNTVFAVYNPESSVEPPIVARDSVVNFHSHSPTNDTVSFRNGARRNGIGSSECAELEEDPREPKTKVRRSEETRSQSGEHEVVASRSSTRITSRPRLYGDIITPMLRTNGLNRVVEPEKNPRSADGSVEEADGDNQALYCRRKPAGKQPSLSDSVSRLRPKKSSGRKGRSSKITWAGVFVAKASEKFVAYKELEAVPEIPWSFLFDNIPADERHRYEKLEEDSEIWVNSNALADLQAECTVVSKYAPRLMREVIMPDKDIRTVAMLKPEKVGFIKLIGLQNLESVRRHLEEYRSQLMERFPDDEDMAIPVDPLSRLKDAYRKVFHDRVRDLVVDGAPGSLPAYGDEEE